MSERDDALEEAALELMHFARGRAAHEWDVLNEGANRIRELKGKKSPWTKINQTKEK